MSAAGGGSGGGINAVPRLEHRPALTLWRLAERWGRVPPAGFGVDLPLTHRLLARVVGAERTPERLARLLAPGARPPRP